MTSYCPYLSTQDIKFTLQIFSRLYFHHAGMTIANTFQRGDGERRQPEEKRPPSRKRNDRSASSKTQQSYGMQVARVPVGSRPPRRSNHLHRLRQSPS